MRANGPLTLAPVTALRNWEIGQKPTLNPKSRNPKLKYRAVRAVLIDGSLLKRVQFEISDFGFKVGFCPIPPLCLIGDSGGLETEVGSVTAGGW
jgi:hypothetical protein